MNEYRLHRERAADLEREAREYRLAQEAKRRKQQEQQEQQEQRPAGSRRGRWITAA